MSTSTARMPKEAIDARITEGLDTDYELYKVIDKNPGQSVYGLAKEMHVRAAECKGPFAGWRKRDWCTQRDRCRVEEAF